MEKCFKLLKLSSPHLMEGEDVRQVQQSLKKLGYKIKVDGIYGEESHKAVIKFQKSNNLDESGVIDSATQ